LLSDWRTCELPLTVNSVGLPRESVLLPEGQAQRRGDVAGAVGDGDVLRAARGGGEHDLVVVGIVDRRDAGAAAVDVADERVERIAGVVGDGDAVDRERARRRRGGEAGRGEVGRRVKAAQAGRRRDRRTRRW
jgi:hypothetical protein